LPQLKDKVVLDLGSNNGYFLYRLAEKGVAMAFGADPLGYCLAQFRFLNHFAQCRQVHLDLWGTEELPLFNQYFDFILFMGVIYHHKNPDQLLKNIHQALKPNGQMIIESITVNPSDLKAEVDENFVLKPKDRYASMRNVHFIPSKMALKNVLIKNGFRIIKEVFDVRLTSEEQRVTAWSRERSLENFLDPENPHLTIEGHPAPWRTAFLVQKIN